MCFRTHTSVFCPTCEILCFVINLDNACIDVPIGGALGDCGWETEDLYFSEWGEECEDCIRRREEEEEEDE
jgi:hypothetical protein